MTELLWKILIICLISAVIGVVLKPKAGEYAVILALAAGIIVMGYVFNAISSPIARLSQLLESYGIETEYFKIALKAVGISYVTDFIADACRDAGQNSLAAKAELAGKAGIFAVSVPLIISVLETAVGFLQ